MDDTTRNRLMRLADSAWESVWKPHADRGDAGAQFELGTFLIRSDDPTEQRRGRQLLESACAQGHGEACGLLSMGKRGDDLRQTLIRAGQLGYAEAYRTLAAIVATGRTVFLKIWWKLSAGIDWRPNGVMPRRRSASE